MTEIVLDPLVIVPLIGGFVGLAVGLVTIWSQIKATRMKAKADFEASNLASENRLKEFFDLKFTIVDVKMDSIKHDIKVQDEAYNHKLKDSTNLFMSLLEKLEHKIQEINNKT